MELVILSEEQSYLISFLNSGELYMLHQCLWKWLEKEVQVQVRWLIFFGHQIWVELKLEGIIGLYDRSQISEEIMTFNFSSIFGVQCCFFFVTQSKDMDVNPYSVILGENTKNSCAIESWWSLKPIGLGQTFSILLTFIYFNIKKNLSYIMS
ncbi:hypothetical protein Leryth_007261 [Lithospermum erythrorhizon]|nr:hypothetical protein Leryth_007261 [Lithospermum erythrorhizon]